MHRGFLPSARSSLLAHSRKEAKLASTPRGGQGGLEGILLPECPLVASPFFSGRQRSEPAHLEM